MREGINMKIENIDFAFCLSVNDDDGIEIDEKIFFDFDEMNAYIEKTWNLPEYSCVTAFFQVLEVINGKPSDAASYQFDISYMPFDDSEIEDYIYDISQAMKESEELKASLKAHSFQKINFNGDYEKKKNRIEEIVYLCPHCFNELVDCKCQDYPWYLIQVDKAIADIIRTLNLKGYTTSACCAGHAEDSSSISLYVAFENEHYFSSIPEGFEYSKLGRSLSIDMPRKQSKEEYLDKQEMALKKLQVWSDELPDLSQ